jgi:hypothetical protein
VSNGLGAHTRVHGASSSGVRAAFVLMGTRAVPFQPQGSAHSLRLKYDQGWQKWVVTAGTGSLGCRGCDFESMATECGWQGQQWSSGR